VTFPLDRPASDCGPGFRLRQPGHWPALLKTYSNLLIAGSQPATDAFLRAATPLLRLPVHCIVCEEGLTISPVARTLILRNVDILTSDEQQALARWLDDEPRPRTQIISQTSAPLYALVQAGAFQEALYYRLNVIYLQVIPD